MMLNTDKTQVKTNIDIMIVVEIDIIDLNFFQSNTKTAYILIALGKAPRIKT